MPLRWLSSCRVRLPLARSQRSLVARTLSFSACGSSAGSAIFGPGLGATARVVRLTGGCFAGFFGDFSSFVMGRSISFPTPIADTQPVSAKDTSDVVLGVAGIEQ